MKQLQKIISIIFIIVFLLNIYMPIQILSLTSQETTNNYPTVDNQTNDIDIDNLKNGEIFVDKSVSTGTITLDKHNFSSNEFLIQLTAIAKEATEKKTPIDVVILLDMTMSTANAMNGIKFSAGDRNGTNDDFIIIINDFIEILMNANEENRIAVLTYAAQDCAYKHDSTKTGNKGIQLIAPNTGYGKTVLLELGHYTNPSWTNIKTSTITPGIGTKAEDNSDLISTYFGGEIIKGKYIDFYESSCTYNESTKKYTGKSVLEGILDDSLQNYTYSNRDRFSFKLQTSKGLLKDKKSYSNKAFGYIGDTNNGDALLFGANYLLEQNQGKTAFILLLTDGGANTINTNYTTEISGGYSTLEYNSTNASNYLTYYSKYNSTNIYCGSLSDNIIGVCNLATSIYARKLLEDKYGEENVYIDTLSAYAANEFALCTLDPIQLKNSTTYTTLYNYMEQLIVKNKSIEVEGEDKTYTFTNLTGKNDYIFNDNFYLGNSTEEIIEDFEAIAQSIIGNAHNGITFKDTLGDNTVFKNLKGVLRDGILYDTFKKTENNGIITYTNTDISGITISLNTTKIPQELTFYIPNAYADSLIRLVFETGLDNNFTPPNDEFVIYSNTSCEANFEITDINHFPYVDNTVDKDDNKSETKTYISKTAINDKNISIDLGNNGKLIFLHKSITKIWEDEENNYQTRPENLEIFLLQNKNKISTITLSDANKIDNKTWQDKIIIPKYDTNGKEYVYTIQEDENNLNLMYYYDPNKTIYDQEDLTVINFGSWIVLGINSIPNIIYKYTITIHKDIIGTTEAFEKLMLSPDNTYIFPIVLKQMNLTYSKGETSMLENYEGFSGNIYTGYVTNKNDLIFADIPAGRYEISEEDVAYFNFNNFSLTLATQGASFTKEDGKYYITISSLTKTNEAITINIINQLETERFYQNINDKNNLFN